jgi:hypothetical protein
MALKHGTVNVRISKRILWFNSEAYPLSNITRANTLTWEPRRGPAIKTYAFSVFCWVVFAGVVSSAAPVAVATVVDLVVLAWLVWKTVRLVEFLKLRLYELHVETAAGSNRALVSNRPEIVGEIAYQITDAINNPHAEFQKTVQNFHVNDSNVNFGTAQTVGNVVR